MVGHDPRDIEQLVRRMNKHGFWRIGVIGKTAISGIEVALLGHFRRKRSACRSGGCSAGGRASRVARLHPSRLGEMNAVYDSARRRHRWSIAGCRWWRAAIARVKIVNIPYTH